MKERCGMKCSTTFSEGIRITGYRHGRRATSSLSRGWVTGVALAVVFMTAAACSDDMAEPVLEVAGDWTFADTVTASFGTCTAAGTVTLMQSGRTLSGVINATEGTCEWADGGSDDNSGPVDISTGSVSPTTVSFTAGICEFTSTSVTDERIEGQEFCTVNTGTQNFVLSGGFTLVR